MGFDSRQGLFIYACFPIKGQFSYLSYRYVRTLRLFLYQIIHNNQSSSVHGRKIASYLILICYMLNYIATKNCPAILTKLDLKKERFQMSSVVSLVSFSDKFIRWVKPVLPMNSIRLRCTALQFSFVPCNER